MSGVSRGFGVKWLTGWLSVLWRSSVVLLLVAGFGVFGFGVSSAPPASASGVGDPLVAGANQWFVYGRAGETVHVRVAKVANSRTGSSSRSGGTATKCAALPMSIPAALGWVNSNA